MKTLSMFVGLCFVAVAPWIVFAFPETPELVRSNVSSLDRSRDWPGWRGPTHDGVSPSSKAPTSWSDSKNVRWVADVPGRGNASPTIVGDCVYLPTCTEESGAQSVLCFDRKTGSQKWSLEVHPSGAVRKNERSTGASSSIASDGQQLFVCFPNNDSVVLSSISLDGTLQWSKRFSDYLVHQGYGASPFLYGSTVIVVADHRGGGTLAALSKKDGSVVWQRERPKDPNYPSPIVHKLFDREQLILIGCDRVISYDPSTGETIWEKAGSTTECVTTTVTDGRHVYSTGGYPKNHMSAVVADGTGKVAWENGERVYVPSLIYKEGFLYGTLDAGIAKCWNAATGEEMWKARLGGNFSASPVLVGEHIYCFNEGGESFVFQANPKEFRQIATNKLGDEVFATPSICGEEIFTRVAVLTDGKRSEKLYCISDKQ